MSATSHVEREERLKRTPRPRPYHQALLLRIAEGQTIAEAANGLGLSVRTCHRWVALHRAQVESVQAEFEADAVFRRRLELALTPPAPASPPPSDSKENP